VNAYAIGAFGAGWSFVRASTAGQARAMHPAIRSAPSDLGFTDVRALRIPELDGPGPARELRWIADGCPLGGAGEPDGDGCCSCGDPWCCEGERPDWQRMRDENGGTG
jgi:hypothetical protein